MKHISPEIVVVSGGPCGGKTTLIDSLPELAATHDRELVLLPEVATHLMRQGVDFGMLATHDRPAYLDVQRSIIRREYAFIREVRKDYAGSDALVVMDRGINDTYAYMQPHEATEIAAEYGTSPRALGFGLTDRIVYLPSIAVRDPARYETLKATNPTRYETAAQAAATCMRTLTQWEGHPGLRVIDVPDFSEKMRLAGAWCLGESATIAI